MKPLINKNGSIEPHEYFKIPKYDIKLKIVCSVSTDFNLSSFKYSAWNCIDSVKNLETGKVTEIERRKLFNKKPYTE